MTSFTHEDGKRMWSLLEEIDAQLDLSDLGHPGLAEKVRVAVWGEQPRAVTRQVDVDTVDGSGAAPKFTISLEDVYIDGRTLEQGTKIQMVGTWGYDANGDMTREKDIKLTLPKTMSLRTALTQLIEAYCETVVTPRHYFIEDFSVWPDGTFSIIYGT